MRERNDVKWSGKPRGKVTKEAREENSRFEPTYKILRQATLLFVLERELKGREKTVYN